MIAATLHTAAIEFTLAQNRPALLRRLLDRIPRVFNGFANFFPSTSCQQLSRLLGCHGFASNHKAPHLHPQSNRRSVGKDMHLQRITLRTSTQIHRLSVHLDPHA